MNVFFTFKFAVVVGALVVVEGAIVFVVGGLVVKL